MNSSIPKRVPVMAQYSPDFSSIFNAHTDVQMFMEDVYLGVMPIGGSTENHKDYDVKLNGAESDIELGKRICSSLAEDEHYYEFRELFADVVENIVKNLAWSGKSFYEIVNDKNDNHCPYLYWFPSKWLFKIPSHFIQILPKKESIWFKRKFSIVNSSNVWEISMPSELGGSHGYSRMLEAMKKTSSLTPKFAKNEIKLLYSTPGYDNKEYNRNFDILINRLTSKWGWNRRDMRDENYTEFYAIFKRISADLVKAILREHITCEINSLLKRLRINSSIEIVGLPTSTSISRAREDLIAGAIDFDEALKSGLVC